MNPSYSSVGIRPEKYQSKNANVVDRFTKWKLSLKRNHKYDLFENLTIIKSKHILTAFVNKLVKIHRAGSINGHYCMHMIHNALYKALRLCYELDLKSQLVVGELIHEIYSCEGNLSAVFDIINLGRGKKFHRQDTCINMNSFILYPGTSVYNFDHIVPYAMAYYLNNIAIFNKNPTENMPNYELSHVLNNFNLDGLSPLLEATRRKHVELVQLLLRYGADPAVAIDTQEDPPRTINPIQQIISIINSFAALQYFTNENAGKVCEDSYKILHLFLKSVPIIHMEVSLGIWGNRCEDKSVYYLHPKVDPILIGNQVPSLRHLSRCTVRKSILQSATHNLPNAIATFSVPYIIKDYLDLKS